MIIDIDRLFGQYRESGDPAILAQVFDATAHKLLLLAVHLTGDELGAEDLVQTAFLKMIERCQQYDPQRHFLPWASAILANEARMIWRKEQQKASGDRLARSVSIDPHQAAAEAEMIELLSNSIDALDEKYRTVLRLKIVHGMKSSEIARILEVPQETVRTRASRGLTLLRRALPAGLSASAMILASGRGLAQVRSLILERASQGASPLTSTPTSTVASSASRVAIGLCILTVIIPAILWLTRDQPDPIKGADTATANRSTPESTGTVETEDVPLQSPSLRSRIPSEELDKTSRQLPAWTLIGAVRGSDAESVVHAEVKVQVLHGCDSVLLPSVFTDRQGRYLVDVTQLRQLGDIGLISANLQVNVQASGYRRSDTAFLEDMPLACREKHSFRLDHTLHPGANLKAEIHASDGQPITSLMSARLVEEATGREGPWSIHEDGQPQILLPVTLTGSLRLEVNTDRGVIRRSLGSLSQGQDLDLGVIRCEEHGLVAGRLVTADGRSIPYQNFVITRIGSEAPLRILIEWQNGEIQLPQKRHGRADAKGVFQVAGMQPGRYRLDTEYSFAPKQSFEVETGTQPMDLTVVGQALEIQMRDSSGRLIPGLTLTYKGTIGETKVEDNLNVSDTGGVFNLLLPLDSSWEFSVVHRRIDSEALHHRVGVRETKKTLVFPVALKPSICRIQLSLSSITGSLIPDYIAELSSPGLAEFELSMDAAGLRARALPVGRYVLNLSYAASAWGTPKAFQDVSIETDILVEGINAIACSVTPGCSVDVRIEGPGLEGPGLEDTGSEDTHSGAIRVPLHAESFVDGAWVWVAALTQEIDGKWGPSSRPDFDQVFRFNRILPEGPLELRIVAGPRRSQVMRIDARVHQANHLHARLTRRE